MGYSLTSLGNLPTQNNISLYVFIIDNGWHNDLTESLKNNFDKLAERIGPNAVLAKGHHPEDWSSQVYKKYMGEFKKLDPKNLPALLITDTHPDLQNANSLRLFVPILDAKKRFGGIEVFFQELSEFSRNRKSDFLERFEDKTTTIDSALSMLELKPNFFGFGVNINELIARIRGR